MGEVMKFPQGAGRQRNASIELLRIVCIAMVTFNHTLNAFYNDGAGALFARYLNFFNICAVGTFFIITGFFLCDGEFAYGKKLKKLLVQVLLPTVFVLLFLVLMGSIWDAAEGAPFGERLLSGLVSVGRETLAWGYSGNYGYLWFVLSYTEIVVFYPVWYLLCKEERVSVVARRLCMSLCFAGIFADNVLHIARASFNLHIFSLINSCVLFVLLGYELKLLLARGKLRGAAGGVQGLRSIWRASRSAWRSPRWIPTDTGNFRGIGIISKTCPRSSRRRGSLSRFTACPSAETARSSS